MNQKKWLKTAGCLDLIELPPTISEDVPQTRILWDLTTPQDILNFKTRKRTESVKETDINKK